MPARSNVPRAIALPRGAHLGILLAATTISLPLFAVVVAGRLDTYVVAQLIPLGTSAIIIMWLLVHAIHGLRAVVIGSLFTAIGVAVSGAAALIVISAPGDGFTLWSTAIAHILQVAINWVVVLVIGCACYAVRTFAVFSSVPEEPHLCRYCGYDLRGLIELHCPECGRNRSMQTVPLRHIARLGTMLLPRMVVGVIFLVTAIWTGVLIQRSSDHAPRIYGAAQSGLRAWRFVLSPQPHWIRAQGQFHQFRIANSGWSLVLSIPRNDSEKKGCEGQLFAARVRGNGSGGWTTVIPSDPVIFCDLGCDEVDRIQSFGVPDSLVQEFVTSLDSVNAKVGDSSPIAGTEIMGYYGRYTQIAVGDHFVGK